MIKIFLALALIAVITMQTVILTRDKTVISVNVPEYHYSSNYTINTVVKEVSQIVEVYRNSSRDWKTVGELTDWCNEHLAIIWISGNKTADCDNYAVRLQKEAFKDCYLLSLQLVENGMLNNKNVSNYTEYHMGNLAIVGNEIYFIEPQPKYFRIVFVGKVD